MENIFCLKNKVALVTGSTRGLGLAIAKGLKDAGAKVYIHGTNKEDTSRIANENKFLYVYGNLKSEDDRNEMLESLISREEKVDILVNNAGFEYQDCIENADEQIFDDVFNVNSKSPYLITKALLPLMKKSGEGSVINITSIHQDVPVRGLSSYCMSKASLAMFTKVAALEFAKYNIRFNSIAPGAIATDMNRKKIEEMDFSKWIPMGRVGSADELVGPAIFLASKASSYMTASTITVDGGYQENLLRY